MGTTPVGGGITIVDIKGLDLESALMAVQTQRASLLETQLKSQMEDVQNRNKDIANLNALLSKLKASRPGGTDPEAWTGLAHGTPQNTAAGTKAIKDELVAAGCTVTADNLKDKDGNGTLDAQQKTFDVWAEQIKGKIDSLNSSQQMDMLRMQSLTNKRNEAFDLMTNFIKKMADSRSSILGNMR